MDEIIQVNQLTRKFGSRMAVDQISFRVKRGEIFGFLGPNGAGKTTTIRMLTGQLLPASGSLSVCGVDPSHEPKKLATHIGVVPEVPNLYLDLTPEQNLNLFADLYGADRQGVKDLLRDLGLSTHQKKKVRNLSKGLAQRVLIARALLHSPELIFLDEPTIGLDPNIAIEIREMIRLLREKGKTIFLTTHYMAEADSLCDRVAIINEGKIIALDSPHQLRLQHGTRQIIVETQNGSKHFPFSQIDQLANLDPEHILSIHSSEPTLEDVFIRLTDRRLEA